ncbi:MULTISPECIES: DUF2306 domain-containing protein [Pandoraea]|uniref:DUF2306 domain-containing protein n=1 Tax=Pandoraea TaxID=93217 RepID=UPI001F5D8A84|nr:MULTISPECIES: DUF2306 domain-containing protein [Pandoraea]MCI3208497.1 hypothetical protein [Pandoraea sp. LA3]MDN4586526.1 hypothetical protein [Pandoraea capi]
MNQPDEDIMATIVAMHLGAAVTALLVGAGILLMPRGTPRHRWLGRLWVVAMAATAATSFGIRELEKGHFSWLHALAMYVLVSLVFAVRAIRQHHVAAHRRQMLGLYAGLAIAGIAAVVVPGRTLSIALAQVWQHDVPPGGSPAPGHTDARHGGDSDKQAGALKQTQITPHKPTQTLMTSASTVENDAAAATWIAAAGGAGQ